jgi:2-methylisocitrate lyase-like PEP mutase family enzyme
MPDLDEQRRRADLFRQMHHGPKILLLPNVWDVASARVIEEAGFKALATTSAGVAFSLGYPDGQKISRNEMLAHVARIVGGAKVPVSADVEAGYGDRPEDAAQTTRAVVEAGAIGMNLEDAKSGSRDTLVNLSLQLEKIRAVREAASAVGVPVVLNARTDVYLNEVGAPATRYDETIKRATAYRDAGADCIFVPGVRDLETISKLVKDVQAPVNILAGPGSPAVPELQKVGVARVSLGSGPMRATLGLLRRIADELTSSGTYATLQGAPAHADVNKLLS